MTGGVGAGAGGAASARNLFRTAFSDTHEPMFEKVGGVQERYMPNSYGEVPPEFLINGAPMPQEVDVRKTKSAVDEGRLASSASGEGT